MQTENKGNDFSKFTIIVLIVLLVILAFLFFFGKPDMFQPKEKLIEDVEQNVSLPSTLEEQSKPTDTERDKARYDIIQEQNNPIPEPIPERPIIPEPEPTQEPIVEESQQEVVSNPSNNYPDGYVYPEKDKTGSSNPDYDKTVNKDSKARQDEMDKAMEEYRQYREEHPRVPDDI